MSQLVPGELENLEVLVRMQIPAIEPGGQEVDDETGQDDRGDRNTGKGDTLRGQGMQTHRRAATRL